MGAASDVVIDEPEMYPLTDYPTFEEKFRDFDALRSTVEKQVEGLNMIQSWLFTDPEDGEEGEPVTFYLGIFLPRLTKYTQFEAAVFSRADVEQWLQTYVRPRIDRWYGWTSADPVA